MRTRRWPLPRASLPPRGCLNNNITKVSSRALWVDFNRAVGVSNYMAEAILSKKERVEALLAIYTSQKTERLRKQTAAAHERAQRGDVARSIN